MIFVYIVLALVALVSFYEYKELSNNFIKNDEDKYGIMCIICLTIIIIMLLTKCNPF